MNTPAQATINPYLLARDSSHPRAAVKLAGALIPDLVIILIYCWHLIQGSSEQPIWEVEYYQPTRFIGSRSIRSGPEFYAADKLTGVKRNPAP